MANKRMGYQLKHIENREGFFTAWSRRASSGEQIIVKATAVGKPLVVTDWVVNKEILQLNRLKEEQGIDADGYVVGDAIRGGSYLYHAIQFYRIVEGI